MKYTIEIKANFEDEVFTDEEIKEIAEAFLNETIIDGTFKTTCEDGRVIEVKK
jgi:hypothetical protein